MKLPNYIPEPQDNSKGLGPAYGSKKAEIVRFNNNAHMIHPSSGFEMYAEGEFDVEKEIRKLENAAENVEEFIDQSLDLNKETIKQQDSVDKQKITVSAFWIKLRNLLLDEGENGSKKEALGGN